MDKFEVKETTKKKQFAKSTWYDFRAHKKIVGQVKDKIMGLFKTNIIKDCCKTLANNTYGGGKNSPEGN